MDRLSWAIGHKFSAEPVRCSGHIDNNVVAARFQREFFSHGDGLTRRKFQLKLRFCGLSVASRNQDASDQ